MTILGENDKKFIRDLKKKCKQHGIKFVISKRNLVKLSPEQYCAGYFQETPKKLLCVAAGNPDWFQILVHESCHMDQYLEKSKIWNNSDSCSSMDDWLSGKTVRNINRHISRIRDLELDCEKRAVDKIKTLGLNINIEKYIQKANTYILFYNYVKLKRKWAEPGNSPYNIEDIWKSAPKYFLDSYDDDVLILHKKFDKHKVCRSNSGK